MKCTMKNRKRQMTGILIMSVMLAFSACGTVTGAGEMESNDVSVSGGDSLRDAPSETVGSPDGGTQEQESLYEHSHLLSEGENTVEHEAVGYCGNTMTTVFYKAGAEGEAWEAYFGGNDSVALTDLLRYLDYSGDVCRCQPEYYVDTEFGTNYGINLTEGYVRHDGGQVSLTEEQLDLIREIFDRQAG